MALRTVFRVTLIYRDAFPAAAPVARFLGLRRLRGLDTKAAVVLVPDRLDGPLLGFLEDPLNFASLALDLLPVVVLDT